MLNLHILIGKADKAVAHQFCAREASALRNNEGNSQATSFDLNQLLGLLLTSLDIERWRCPGCVENEMQPDTLRVDQTPSPTARRSSVPKLARDLLPSHRAIKPDSHSVFSNLIVDDDPMDGSRMLRKRKTPSVEVEDSVVVPLRKRRNNPSDGSSHTSVVVDTFDVEEKPVEETQVEAQEAEDDEEGEPIAPRSSRSLRIKLTTQQRSSILKSSRSSLIVNLKIDSIDGLRHVLEQPPKPAKKKRVRATVSSRRRSTAQETYPTHSYSQPFYSFHDKEIDELKSKPYGGILNETEADTSKTLPQPEDRRRFDDARQKAEEEWKLKTAAALAEAEPVKKPRKVSGPASQIECINFGGYEIDTWYAAPYPEEYSRNRVLYICEFCLKYMNSEYVAWRHKMKCQAKNPPGDEIYRDGSVAVFEVDGRKNPVYCQNLCLLAKLFLGSKTLYYDVEPFLFYVMTEYDELGCHFVGYFSKEKRPSSQNNVSCILTLPIHQRKGYGNLLIDFSYLLTRVEKKSGSPEKPLSDMGLVSYRNYWRLVLCYQMRNMRPQLHKSEFSILDISERTGMTADDIVSALEGLRALVRDPLSGTYALRLDFDFFEEYILKWENKNYVRLNPKGLVWTPYLMGRNNASVLEHGGPMNAIAAREDEDDMQPTISLPALTNGDSQTSTNGNTNGDLQIIELGQDGEGGARNKTLVPSPGKGKGKTPLIDPDDPSPISPSSTRLLRQSNSTPSKMNGFAEQAPIPPPLITTPEFIPPTRFEIFPPVAASRKGIPRPILNRNPTSSARPPRTSFSANTSTRSPVRKKSRPSSSRRSTASRPRSSTARKRTGGTGRGPGRWPKGTTKKDFGDAPSGPGLPPRILKARSKLANEVSGDENEDELKVDMDEDEDAILYETPAVRRRSRVPASAGRNSKPRIFGQGKGKGKGVAKEDEDDEDELMADSNIVFGDIDAEGEDE